MRYSYAGNWTALFCTGALFHAPPAALQAENIYLFPNSFGYDGQQYHYIAHDPFFTRGFASSLDAPRLRYRRILIPVLAFALAFGRDPAIDLAYVVVVAAFIVAGTYWLGRVAVWRGYPAAGGLLFGLAPAVLVSVDRLTVDVALAACCAGFAWYVHEQSAGKLYAVLGVAGLARETGLLLVAAYAIYWIGKRQFRSAIVFSTAAVPALCWYLVVQFHTAPDHSSFITPAVFSGLVHRVFTPADYPFSRAIVVAATSLDLLGLAGIAGAVGWALYRALRRAWTPVTVAVYLFAMLAIMLSAGDPWTQVYAFGRTLTPLLLMSAMDGAAMGSAIPLFAMLALDPRIALQMGGQILNVARGLLF